jgi:hypothetical protein
MVRHPACWLAMATLITWHRVGEVVVVASQRVLDEVVAEFEASCAGRLKLLAHRTEISGGALECCGSHVDPTRWTGAFVRTDRAVLPLTAGERDRVVLECVRFKRAGTPLWNPAKFPPPKVIVAGRAYHFAPAYGRRLIGLVKLERRAVLLAAISDALAVIHVAGRATSVLHVGKPHSFHELDVDQLLQLQGRRGSKPQRPELSGPVRPPPPIEAEHRRIVHGLAVEVGTGPTIAQVLGACFEDVADRARALKAAVATQLKDKLEVTADRARRLKTSAARRVRGKMWVRPVLRYLSRLAILGHGNIVGRVGEIIAMLREHFPDFAITAEALSDVLGLLHALGTCLVSPRADGDRIWEINLAGLTDPRSALHRRLCRETKGRHLVAMAAMGAVAGPEQAAPSPTDAPLAAEVDAVEAPLDHGVVDVAGILDELCRLPPGAGAVLLATTLKPGAPEDAVNANTASAPEPDGEVPVDVPAVASAMDPALDEVDAPPLHAPDLTSTAPGLEQGSGETVPLDMVVPQVSPTPTATPELDGGDIKAVLDELRRLPAVAARTLLLGSRVYRKRLETAAAGEDAGHAAASPDPPLPRAPQGRPGRPPRRRLHLSPDHTLVLPRVAVVAEVPSTARSPGDASTRDVVLGPTHPVGDGPVGARGPPVT